MYAWSIASCVLYTYLAYSVSPLVFLWLLVLMTAVMFSLIYKQNLPSFHFMTNGCWLSEMLCSTSATFFCLQVFTMTDLPTFKISNCDIFISNPGDQCLKGGDLKFFLHCTMTTFSSLVTLGQVTDWHFTLLMPELCVWPNKLHTQGTYVSPHIAWPMAQHILLSKFLQIFIRIARSDY